MKDICCIGHITKDKIITPRQTVYMAGGTSFYFSYAINHLPDNVSFQLVTKLGEGEMKAVEDMRNVGIDVLTYPSSHTVYFENKYGEDQNDRTQRVLERADPFTIEEMKNVDARVYHLGTLLNDDISPELVKYLSARFLSTLRDICARCAIRRCSPSTGLRSARYSLTPTLSR